MSGCDRRTVKIDFDPSAIAETKWHQYAVRFVFGGLVTLLAGMIAKRFGPVVGGLFLAFPAIFPASATLIEKHERKKKEKKGLRGAQRASAAVSVDAAGAAMGAIGLAVFALIVWKEVAKHPPWLVLTISSIAWLMVAVMLWQVRKRL